MITFGQTGYVKGVIVPVLAHIDKVQMIGLMRLRYRPHTRLTAAWWAEHHAVCHEFIDSYNALATPVVPAALKSVSEPQSAHSYLKTGTHDGIPF